MHNRHHRLVQTGEHCSDAGRTLTEVKFGASGVHEHVDGFERDLDLLRRKLVHRLSVG